MLPTLVLCGGRGTRLTSVTGGDLPKALVPVAGRCFIDHKLDELRSQGLVDVVLSIGFGGDQIRAHVGDGARFGVRVRYVDDGDELLGTGGAVAAAVPLLRDSFWVTYGDTLVDVDVAAAEDRLHRTGRRALMTVLHNQDRWQPSNARVEDGLVVAYAKRNPPSGAEHIDYGMLILPRSAFTSHDRGRRFDLEPILRMLVDDGELVAFEARTPFHDIGTPEALRSTDEFLRGRTA